MVLFGYYSLMETLHIAESVSKCEQVQSITLTRQFFRIEMSDIFRLFISKYTIQRKTESIFCGGK